MARPTRLTDEIVADYLRRRAWQRVTLADCWDRQATCQPQDTAVTDGQRRLTWAQARKWTERAAVALVQLGLARDEVLVLQLPNCAELPLIRVACEKAGILCLPVPRTLRQKEMGYCLSATEAAAVVIPWRYRDFDYFAMIQELKQGLPRLRHILIAGDQAPEGALALDPILEAPWEERIDPAILKGRTFRADEVSLINATTGSTGLPKFSEYSAAARLLYGRSYVEVLGLSERDALAALSPAAGGPNIPVYFAAPQVGAKAVFMTHFEVGAAFELIMREKVTVACLVPAQLALLIHDPDLARRDLSSVRFWLSVGAPLAARLAQEAEEKLGAIVLNTYGAVDWGGVVFTSPEDSKEVRYNTVGRARVGTEVRLVDEGGNVVGAGQIGELQGRGPSCSSGYYKDPEGTEKSWTRDGWFPLGDLGRWTDGGNLVIVGRKSDLIIRGGQNIQPGEIEDLLLAHGKIRQAAVVGMPDPILGERVCAYVIARADEPPTLEEIVSFLRSRKIAPYKLPERLEVVERLPMISDTKVDKRLLAVDISAKLQAES
jgi:non-ribosomal peptide synthetase component E (peptide arylation enzyme)